MSYDFYAFISYKRGEADEKWARKLQAELERYRIPAADLQAAARPVRGDETAPPKRLKVFRDKSDLGSHFSVEGGLFENLDVSRFLIVICSRRGARSPYVDAEVRRFVETGRKDQIIPLVIGASSADPASRPPSLPPEVEAAAASGDYEETLIHLLARLLRVDRDNLRQAHLRASRRRVAFRLALVAAVLVLTAGLALWAVSAEKRATERRIESEELVDFLTFDLVWACRDWLPSNKRASITNRVLEYYNRWEARGPRAVLTQAVNQRQRADIVAHIDGRPSEAIAVTSQTLEPFERLYKDNPNDEAVLLEYSHTLLFLGALFEIAGDLEKADSLYRQNLELTRASSKNHPDSLTVKGQMTHCLISLAKLGAGLALSEYDPERKEKHFEEAEALYRECEELWREMLSRWPRETQWPQWRLEYGDFWSFRAVSSMHQGDFRAALTYLSKSIELFEILYLENPQNLTIRLRYAYDASKTALVTAKWQKLELADQFFQLGDQLWQELAEEDPNRVHALGWADLLMTGGFLRIEQGRPDEAEKLLNYAEEIVDDLLDIFPEQAVYLSSKELIEEYRKFARQKSAGGMK
jgi:tetratricopeptide (TPR) repeat protein